MAYIVPSDLPRLHLSGGHAAEIKVLQTLKAELSNDFTVFHGVHWSREYEKWTHFGEIDFVVLNQSGKVLCIEQKNGSLTEVDNQLLKQYRNEDKNVVEQIHRSINKIREKFSKINGKSRALEVDYLIYCPDYRVKKISAAGLDKDRIVDASSKESLAERITTVLGQGAKARDGWREKVEKFFLQTFDLAPDIHAHIEHQEKRFVRQSGSLANILMNLEMQPFRLKVSGTAGSGKSLFARRYFDHELEQTRNILLVCFNRPLADRLADSIGKAGRVNTFFGFCDEFLQSRGKQPDFSSMHDNPDFWNDVLEDIANEEIADDWMFDSLIVDEGQDFEKEWFEILRLFLRENANILWLEDNDQNLYGKQPVALEGFVGYRCPQNYRSPESIAEFIARTLPMSFEQGNDLPGLGVGVHGYKTDSEQPGIVRKIVNELMRKGFSREDMIVMSCKGMKASAFSGLEQIGDLSLNRFTGRYDQDGKQIWTGGDLTFETVYRFKGLERPAVIMVDVDPDPKQPLQESVLYCGMTRATVRLDILVNSDNRYNSRFLDG